MFANESKARMAYVSANRKLETALAEFTQARTELHQITGEFAAVDNKLSLQFSTRTGESKIAQIELTDC
jgi:hypothetical protein